VGFNTIPDYVNPFSDEPNPAPYPAVELIYGTLVDGVAAFVKANPIKRSIHEKSSFYAIYRSATGKAPVAGARVADILGKGVMATITNEAKISKVKKTPYTKTSIKDIAAVFPKLRSEIVPIEQLKPALEAALAKTGQKQDGDDANPFGS